LALLKDLCAGVSGWIRYQSRDDEGVQSPIETLDRGWGSCRDFAVLFVEAARCLGFGARIVSGYLHAVNAGIKGSADAGSTHAWAEVYVSGAGWITFDPTNRSVGGYNLIPVAVARDTQRTETTSPIQRRHGRIGRRHVDERPAFHGIDRTCVPGTAWGTASSRTAKSRSTPCLSLRRPSLPQHPPRRQGAKTRRSINLSHAPSSSRQTQKKPPSSQV
jgi:hypothetical protein